MRVSRIGAEEVKMSTAISSTQVLGARLLKEIGDEEGSLEDVGLKPSLSCPGIDPYR